MQKLTYCLAIKQTFVPIYHSEANLVEPKNGDLKMQLDILVGDNHQEWSKHLAAIRFAIALGVTAPGTRLLT